MNIHQSGGSVNRQTTPRTCTIPTITRLERGHLTTLRPPSAPDRVAGGVYEVTLPSGETIRLLSSWRKIPKQDASGCFNWDCRIIEIAIAQYGVTVLEVYDKSTRNTYTTTTEILHQHGQIQTRWAGTPQWALHQRYYSVNGATPAAFRRSQPQPQPEAEQPALFAFAEPGRRGGGY